jgi:hypothetical protein
VGHSLDKYLTTRLKTYLHTIIFQEKPLAEKPNQDIIDYLLWQRNQGKAEPTIICRVRGLKKLAHLGILYDSEAVKMYFATSPIQNTTKKKVVDTYMTFLNFKGLKWIAPKYQKTTKVYFIAFWLIINVISDKNEKDFFTWETTISLKVKWWG